MRSRTEGGEQLSYQAILDGSRRVEMFALDMDLCAIAGAKVK